MPDYQKSKIYRLVCNITGKQYIGSTVSRLSRRKNQHKEKYDLWKNGTYHYVSSFDVIENGNYDIILIENYPCKSKEELLSRERYYMETMDCVNVRVPYREEGEWYKMNKQHKKQYDSERRKKIFTCECGSKDISYAHKADHFKTQKHQDFIKSTS